MQPSIALSLNQHLELEQSRRHLDGIDDLQRLKEMAKEFLLNWQLERAESKRASFKKSSATRHPPSERALISNKKGESSQDPPCLFWCSAGFHQQFFIDQLIAGNGASHNLFSKKSA